MPVVPWHCITQRSLGHRNHTIYFIVLLIRFLELKKKKKKDISFVIWKQRLQMYLSFLDLGEGRREDGIRT